MNYLKKIYKIYNIFIFKFKYKYIKKNTIFNIAGDPKFNGNHAVKIALVAMIKNEADIIEHFIRINNNWASHIYIIDDNSADDTNLIINSLIDEGFAVTLISNNSISYQQNFLTTDLVRMVSSLNKFDYIFPLDADEFIGDNSKFFSEIARLSSSNSSIGILNWTSLVPISSKSMDLDNPFHYHFQKVMSEVKVTTKVIIPNELGKSCFLSMGNHDVYSDKLTISQIILNIDLFHAPVRSFNQILVKILIGSYKFTIKKNKTRGEGNHWLNMANYFRSINFKLDDNVLRKLAFNYASQLTHDPEGALASYQLQIPEYVIKYKPKSSNGIFIAFDSFISELLANVKIKN